ncbi:MAG: hypothetical protein ACI857_002862, partial [Arenicella sp.]
MEFRRFKLTFVIFAFEYPVLSLQFQNHLSSRLEKRNTKSRAKPGRTKNVICHLTEFPVSSLQFQNHLSSRLEKRNTKSRAKPGRTKNVICQIVRTERSERYLLLLANKGGGPPVKGFHLLILFAPIPEAFM